MGQQDWISLTEYSNRYKVSISTLRRRIKAAKAEFEFRDGKYFLKNSPLKSHQVAPTATNRKSTTIVNPPSGEVSASEALANEAATQTSATPVLGVANQLLGELKKAYSQILQEKEEQILQLREEVADLKTLVRILESENDRLQVNVTQAAPIDSWLETIK